MIERSVILMQENELMADDLPEEIRRTFYNKTDAIENTSSMAAIEKEHIHRVLKSTNGNKAEAARILQIGIATLYRKIEEYKL